MDAHILLVEDDDTMRHLLANVLSDAGYRVTLAADGEKALALLDELNIDIIVTDIRMNGVDGLMVLQAARKRSLPPEVILLTGYASLETALAALRVGAFNYLMKPCDSTELLACVASAVERRLTELRRIEAMRSIALEFARFQAEEESARRPRSTVPKSAVEARQPQRYLQVGRLSLDVFQHTAVLNGQPLHLTPTEFAFLRCLAEVPGRVLSCADIVRHTHGYSISEVEAQALLRAHVRNLRRKCPPGYVITVRNAGYMLLDPDGELHSN